jgi:hypothetical protein
VQLWPLWSVKPLNGVISKFDRIWVCNVAPSNTIERNRNAKNKDKIKKSGKRDTFQNWKGLLPTVRCQVQAKKCRHFNFYKGGILCFIMGPPAPLLKAKISSSLSCMYLPSITKKKAGTSIRLLLPQGHIPIG